jgi:hypothetical protein
MARLVAVCDVCRKLIDDGQEANICWVNQKDYEYYAAIRKKRGGRRRKAWQPPKHGDFFDYRITCSVECTKSLEGICDCGGLQSTEGLGLAIIYLIKNAGIDLEQARYIAERLEG